MVYTKLKSDDLIGEDGVLKVIEEDNEHRRILSRCRTFDKLMDYVITTTASFGHEYTLFYWNDDFGNSMNSDIMVFK